MSAIDAAVKFVHQEACSLGGLYDQNHPQYTFYAALSAMNYVQHRLSSARFSYLNKQGDIILPNTVQDSLDQEIGICGNHTQVFIEILNELNLPCRDVQVYYKSENNITVNHIFPEVFWDDAWHMFDVTWGWFPYDVRPELVLNFDQIKGNKPYNRLTNQTNSWAYAVWRNSGDNITEYVRRQDYGILYDGGGVITPPLYDIGDGVLKADFNNLPNYLGVGALINGGDSYLSFKINLSRDKLHCILLDLELKDGAFARVLVGPWEKFIGDTAIIECPNVKGDIEISLKPFQGLPGHNAKWKSLLVLPGNDTQLIEKYKSIMEQE